MAEVYKVRHYEKLCQVGHRLWKQETRYTSARQARERLTSLRQMPLCPSMDVNNLDVLNVEFRLQQAPTMTASFTRPLKGSRISSFYPVKAVPPLSSLESAFQLQEYISLLIRHDIHDVDAIVSIPDASRDGPEEDKEGRDVTVDEACWIYEQLRYVLSRRRSPAKSKIYTGGWHKTSPIRSSRCSSRNAPASLVLK